MAEAEGNFSTLRQLPAAAERPRVSLEDAVHWVAYRGRPALWPPPEGAPTRQQETTDTKRLALEHLKRCRMAAGKLLAAFQAGILETLSRPGVDPHAEWKLAPPDFWRDIKSLAEATMVRGPSPGTLSPRITADPRLIRYVFLVDAAQLYALWPPKLQHSDGDRIVIAYGKSHPRMGADAIHRAVLERRPELKGQISRPRVRELIPDRKGGRPTKSRR